MDKIDAIIKNLESIKHKDNILTITTERPIPIHFKLNLFFQKDKDLYVMERILHKIFLPFYPKTLEIIDWEITEEEYGKDYLLFTFQISKEEYIDFIYRRFMDIFM